MPKKTILSMTTGELSEFLQNLGEPQFRAGQILDWIYRKGTFEFDSMTNLPATLREKLKEKIAVGLLETVTCRQSGDGTAKLLFRLADGESVEKVLLPYRTGYSVCVSSQAGCRMGCAFCASGLPGLIRNLTAAEMMAQLLQAREVIHQNGQKLNSIVVMGSGEPLDNWDALIEFLLAVKDPLRLGMSLRHVTISTCGLVPKIMELAKLGFPVTLAVSLHAPSDELRSRLMPINKKYPLSTLLKACREFAAATGRRVTFEYVMIKGLNDSDQHARELSGLLDDFDCHVNIIPFNEVKEKPFEKSDRIRIERFAEILRKNGLKVTVRRRMGSDIAAACGQLRNLTLRGDGE